jgi:hypothetical protein
VPFDVDLGYLGEGIEVATYSRCRQEPRIIGGGSSGLLPSWATGRGCDIYVFDFSERREVKYKQTAGGHASEFLPTAAPGGIAFARVYERRRGRAGKLPYLYVKRRSLRRLPGGPRGKTGLPGPTSLDLSGPRLAFGWDWTPLRRGISASKVLVDVVGGSHRTLESVLGGLTLRTLFSPSIVGREVLWGRTVAIEADRSDFHVHSAASRGALQTAPGPTFLVSTAGVPSRGGIYYLTTQNLSVLSKPPPCSVPSGPLPLGSPHSFPAACTIGQTGTLAFTPVRR